LLFFIFYLKASLYIEPSLALLHILGTNCANLPTLEMKSVCLVMIVGIKWEGNLILKNVIAEARCVWQKDANITA
jgi:hypothetical protein